MSNGIVNGDLVGRIKDGSSYWTGERWHQFIPRPMVEGDIGRWNEGRLSPLEKRVNELVGALKVAGYYNNYTQTVMDTLQDHIDKQEIEWQKVKDELHQKDRLIDLLRTVSARRYQKIADLQEVIRVSNEFIELQAQRLANARLHVERVHDAVNKYEPGDSGPSLDP